MSKSLGRDFQYFFKILSQVHLSIGMIFCNILLVLLCCQCCFAWDSVDLEIFDLVEEVGLNRTFYEVLGVGQDASTSEIRKAYRKLSLLYHPDKSTDPDAEIKFRNLVSVNEILKDAEKRKKYDQVLQDGLPDWRQPIYYYRKARKMGLKESLVVLFLIATVGHFLFKWAAYLEKKYELEEIFENIKKKQEKKRAKGKGGDMEDLDDMDSILEREFGYKRPRMYDLLPFVLYHGVVGFIRSIPEMYNRYKTKLHAHLEEKRRHQEEEEELKRELEQQQQAEKLKPKRKQQQVVLRDASEYENAEKARVLNAVDLARCSNIDAAAEAQNAKSGDWDEQDLAALVKAIAKFPGGIPGRWERIAHEIGRPVNEVTKRMKEMKENIAASNNTAGQMVSSSEISMKKRAVNLSDDLVTKVLDSQLNKKIVVSPNDFYMSQDDIPDDYDQGTDYTETEVEMEQYVRRRKVKRKGIPFDGIAQTNVADEEGSSSDNQRTQHESCECKEKEHKEETENELRDIGGSWTQTQQKCLETALAQFSKTVPDRWTCIARAVPGKSKEECLARYKTLVNHIRKKRTTATPN